jgi:hypothetical protein
MSHSCRKPKSGGADLAEGIVEGISATRTVEFDQAYAAWAHRDNNRLQAGRASHHWLVWRDKVVAAIAAGFNMREIRLPKAVGGNVRQQTASIRG